MPYRGNHYARIRETTIGETTMPIGETTIGETLTPHRGNPYSRIVSRACICIFAIKRRICENEKKTALRFYYFVFVANLRNGLSHFLKYDFWERPILIIENPLLKSEKKDYLQ